MPREIPIPVGSTLVASDEDEDGTGQQSLEDLHVSRPTSQDHKLIKTHARISHFLSARPWGTQVNYYHSDAKSDGMTLIYS